MQIQFDNYAEWDELVYAAREAQIRFQRLRGQLKRGEEVNTGHDEDYCTEMMQKYSELEQKLRKLEPHNLRAAWEEETGCGEVEE